MNECQVTITETTTDGRKELRDDTGMLSYPQVMQLGLQRASTAREAIKIMAELMDKYGYNSEGENFSVCDPNEAWVMELLVKARVVMVLYGLLSVYLMIVSVLMQINRASIKFHLRIKRIACIRKM